MRLTTTLAVCGAAVAQASSVVIADTIVTSLALDTCDDVPTLSATNSSATPSWAPTQGHTTTVSVAPTTGFANSTSVSTATGTTPTTTASTTESPPPEVTAGAIPQQLKGSIAGLLGFFIVGLVVL